MMLIYIGDGFYPGIPASNISDEQLAALEPVWVKMKQANGLKGSLKQFLIQSGQYKLAPMPKANKALIPGQENK
jgi:hypothetical protein